MVTWKLYMAVMLGGALGSGARLWVSELLLAKAGPAFPWGTLAVNILGSFAIGLISGLSEPGGPWTLSPVLRAGILIGVLGGFTTFSSFSFQTLLLVQNTQYAAAGVNILASVLVCLGAAWLGLVLAGRW